MSRRFLYFAIIGLTLGALLLGLPYGLKHLAEQQMRAKLDQQGIDLTWEKLAWQWPSSVELNDVSFSTQRSGIGVSGAIESVEVDLSASALLGETAEIGDISLRSATLQIQKSPQDTPSNDEVSNTSTTSKSNQSALWKSLWKNLWGNLGKLGALDAEDIDISLIDDTDTLLALHIATLALSKDGASDAPRNSPDFLPPETAHRTIYAQGRIELKTSKYTTALARLSGAGNTKNNTFKMDPNEWSLDGYLAPAERSIQLKLGAPSPDDALFSLNIPTIADLNIHYISASLDRSRQLDLSAHQTSVRLGSVGKPAAELDVLKIRATRGANTPLRWTLLNPTLAVAPTRLIELQSSLAELLASLKQKSDTDTDAATSVHTSSPAGWRLRLANWLQRTELSISDGHFNLRLIENGNKMREIALVQHLQGSLRGGEVQAQGISAGGSVAVGARFTPGLLIPVSMAVNLDNIRLDDLPGIKGGRTLPKRGPRGRIGGIVDANLQLWTQGAFLPKPSAFATVNLGGSLTWRDGMVDISGLAEKPIDDVNAGTDFLVSWAANTSVVELSHARLRYGPIVGHLRGQWAGYPLDPVLDLSLGIDEIACQKAVRALPDALLGAYREIEIDGSAAPRFSVHLPANHPRKIRIHLENFVDKCHVTALRAHEDGWPALRISKDKTPPSASSPKPAPPQKPAAFDPSNLLARFNPKPAPEPWPAPPFVRDETYELPKPPEDADPEKFDDVLWLNRNFVKQVTEGVSEEAEVFVGPATPDYQPLRDLAPFVAAAAYLSEEMQFYEDHGIDLGLIQRALRIDFEKGRFVYGGSTITQQLVKNLFLSRDKRLARKFKEALISWRIEDAVPKWRVLELYINCIEFAQDIYGIGPAARYYFDKEAVDLTPKEAVFLAVLKPAPWYGDRFRRRGATPSKHWWFNRMGEIMGRLVDKGYLTAEQAEAEKPYILYWDADGKYQPDMPAQEQTPGAQKLADDPIELQ